MKGTTSISHAVVVDRVSFSGTIHIRDPWDQTTYTMTIDDFKENWTGGGSSVNEIQS